MARFLTRDALGGGQVPGFTPPPAPPPPVRTAFWADPFFTRTVFWSDSQ